MFGKTLSRAAVVAVAATTVIIAASSAAYAGDLTVWTGDRGSITHIDNGDRFLVCDRKADGKGVFGAVEEDGRTLGSQVDGGDSGCDEFTYNVREGHVYQLVVCINGGGSCEWSYLRE